MLYNERLNKTTNITQNNMLLSVEKWSLFGMQVARLVVNNVL